MKLGDWYVTLRAIFYLKARSPYASSRVGHWQPRQSDPDTKGRDVKEDTVAPSKTDILLQVVLLDVSP